MRKFKIRKVKATKIFSISPEEDRVQTLTSIAQDLERYTPAEMPEIGTIKSWVRKELSRNLAKVKVQHLFHSKT